MSPVLVTVSLQAASYAKLSASNDARSYKAFQDATSEATRFVKGVGKVAPLDKLQDVVKRLREVTKDGESLFDVVLEGAVEDALSGKRMSRWLDGHSVKDRIATIDEEIFARLGMRLFPYQHEGTRWLAVRDAALLADDPGTGKTLQTVVAAPSGVPILVVCPVKVKGVWLGETARWRPQISVKVLRGRDSFRWPKSSEMLVLNYDILPNVHDERVCDGFKPAKKCQGCATREIEQRADVVTVIVKGEHLPDCTGVEGKRKPCPGCHPLLRQAEPGTVVVFDEAHKLKNDKAGRSRQAKALAAAARATEGGRTWLLTGTPLVNTPMELWNVLDIAGLAEEAFEDKETFYRLFHASRKNAFGGFVFGTPDEEVKDRLRRVSLRRMKRDVMPELPTKMWRDVPVEIDRKAILACERFVSDNGGLERLVELLNADKIPFELMSAVREALATAKIAPMLEFVSWFEEEGEPVVVFSAHRRPIETLAKRKGWAVVMGGMSEKMSDEAIRAFQAGELKGLGVTIGSGSEGITLTHAAQAVFVDLAWTPAANLQAEDRLVRIGQKRNVVISILHANHPLDARVTEVLHVKTKLFEETVNAAAVGPEERIDTELDAFMARIQAEMDAGDPTRYRADSDVQRATLQALETYVFEWKGDEKLALEIVEEESAIGLTEHQWALAVHVAKKGQPKKESVTLPEEETSEHDPRAELIKERDRGHDPRTAAIPSLRGAQTKERGKKTMRMSDRGRDKDNKDNKERARGHDPRAAMGRSVPTLGRSNPDKSREREERDSSRLQRRMERDEEEVIGVLGEFEERLDLLEPGSRANIFAHMLEDMMPRLEDMYCLTCGEDGHDDPKDCPEYDENAPPSSQPPDSEPGKEE